MISDVNDLHNLLLRYFGGKDQSEIYFKSSGTNYHCPNTECPGNQVGNHSYNKNKLGVSYDLFVYHCWLCNDSGSLLTLANKYFDSIDKAELKQYKETIHPKVYQNYTRKYVSNIELENQINSFEPFSECDFELLEFDLEKKSALNYLFQRNVTWEDIRAYDIMYSRYGKYSKRLIFPSYNKNHEVNYFVSRNCDREKGFYINAETDKKQIIFNEHLIDWKKELIIVEGVFDYIALHGHNRGLLLGSYIDHSYELFQQIIGNGTPVILLLDPDALDKTYKIAEQFIRWRIPVSIGTYSLIQEGLKDAGEMIDKSVIEKIYNEPKIYNKFQLMNYKMEKGVVFAK